jgi:serine/threonine-protein kinase RsbW
MIERQTRRTEVPDHVERVRWTTMLDLADDARADTIEVILPARVEWAATLRVLVASLGADADFSVDEIDDLRLAVSEVFTTLSDTAVGGTCSTAFVLDGHSISVSMRLGGDGADEVALDSLAEAILSAVVDEHMIKSGVITLVKRAAESATRPA